MASAAARYKLLKEAASDIELQAQIRQVCSTDIHFWFDHFAYTFNPRVQPADLPFNLMDFQREIVNVTVQCIREGEPVLFEKSRDMGLTWILALVLEWFWEYEPGSDFLIGSKNQDLVDKKGDRSTIFQKLRYNIALQPKWLFPKHIRGWDTFLKLVHPINGNTIVGSTSTPDFGRSGRYRAALMDEMAFHPYGKAAYESASHSTNCILMPSTPNGKANEFYKLRSHDDVEWIDLEGPEDPLDAAR